MPKTATKDKLQQAHERLAQAVDSILSGDDWQRMLEVASKFHNYSFNNQLMIVLKRPDATHVAGFNRWKSLNRFVKKGEKGIAIFAPCKYRTKVETDDGEETSLQQIRGFRVVHVFDISQTEGEPLRDLDAVRPKLLDGAAPEGIWDALVAQADAAGFEVIRDRKGSENGYCDFLRKKVAVRPDVSQAQALKTLVHELGHALLHADNPPKTRRYRRGRGRIRRLHRLRRARPQHGRLQLYLRCPLVGGETRAPQGHRRAGHRLRQGDPVGSRREITKLASGAELGSGRSVTVVGPTTVSP